MDKETKRVMEKTGLSEYEADAYWCFYRNADFSGELGIILPGDVEFDLGNFLDKLGITSEKTPEERQNIAQKTYCYWLHFFRRKGLIAKEGIKCNPFSPDFAYPFLVGYQPLNDVELYVAYRKKGDERWSGRMSAELLDKEEEWMKERGYEFRV